MTISMRRWCGSQFGFYHVQPAAVAGTHVNLSRNRLWAHGGLLTSQGPSTRQQYLLPLVHLQRAVGLQYYSRSESAENVIMKIKIYIQNLRIEESCEISSECEKFEPHLFSDWRNFRLMKVAFDQISDFAQFVSADYSKKSSYQPQDQRLTVDLRTKFAAGLQAHL